MRVFLTGATGYIGTAVAEALQAAGHELTGLARSDAAAARLAAAGVRPVRGDFSDHGDTGGAVVDETSPVRPAALVAWRQAVEDRVREGAKRGIRSVVIRPAVVYGRGGGIPAGLVESARKHGAARFVGTGENRWPLVHVDDLAELYRLALDKAPAGSVFLAVHGPARPVRELAAAASRGAGAGGRTVAWPLEEARVRLGAFADALILDQQGSGRRAEALGRRPHGPDPLADLESGSYARRAS